MLFQRITRTGPEKVFAIVKNDETSVTLVDGDVVNWVVAASKNYGSDVIRTPAAASEVLVAGVISGKDIAPGDFGTCQVYGYHSNVKSGTSSPGAIQGTITTIATLGNGAGTDSPGAYIGVCLKGTISGRAGIQIQRM